MGFGGVLPGIHAYVDRCEQLAGKTTLLPLTNLDAEALVEPWVGSVRGLANPLCDLPVGHAVGLGSTQRFFVNSNQYLIASISTSNSGIAEDAS